MLKNNLMKLKITFIKNKMTVFTSFIILIILFYHFLFAFLLPYRAKVTVKEVPNSLQTGCLKYKEHYIDKGLNPQITYYLDSKIIYPQDYSMPLFLKFPIISKRNQLNNFFLRNGFYGRMCITYVTVEFLFLKKIYFYDIQQMIENFDEGDTYECRCQ